MFAVNGEESDVMSYTSKWISLVNRGGLFEISDSTYIFFKEVELRVQKELFLAFERNQAMGPAQRDFIITAVAIDDTIQFHWTILSVDITDEDQAIKVLREIIGLWVNIRGYSIANSCLAKISNSTKKKKSLRKELKRSSESNTEKNTK